MVQRLSAHVVRDTRIVEINGDAFGRNLRPPGCLANAQHNIRAMGAHGCSYRINRHAEHSRHLQPDKLCALRRVYAPYRFQRRVYVVTPEGFKCGQ